MRKKIIGGVVAGLLLCSAASAVPITFDDAGAGARARGVHRESSLAFSVGGPAWAHDGFGSGSMLDDRGARNEFVRPDSLFDSPGRGFGRERLTALELLRPGLGRVDHFRDFAQDSWRLRDWFRSIGPIFVQLQRHNWDLTRLDAWRTFWLLRHGGGYGNPDGGVRNVPEPGGLAMFAIALLGLGFVCRKRNVG